MKLKSTLIMAALFVACTSTQLSAAEFRNDEPNLAKGQGISPVFGGSQTQEPNLAKGQGISPVFGGSQTQEPNLGKGQGISPEFSSLPSGFNSLW